ncbi:Retrovirus-related Pol polyprotein from transposon TNT 1-94 [Cucumis melo var. makuwa]|uniref:Retrovirus-related Pol polyprotein from transposon TNT 1-94 n=1 Tax=Cucumis melo var. makuwa TaxID=1194695 RepID=A0A5D3CYW3_CUCMM|nr:Retrovirus-related Pol polyprotein from transposon TNT 1-94 [Cucumis melo var. makuwa]
MVTGLPQIEVPIEVCEKCVVSKQHRDPFPTGKSWRAKRPLELDKSKAFIAFRSYKVQVEKEIGSSIKVLRTDRGGEFENFCENNRIKRQLTATYTLQQNGVCERKNRTLLNMKSHTCCTKYDYEEAWSGWRSKVDYFKIFGCIAYAHILDQKRTKLDDKGEKCIFLGVGDQSKAYKLYNPYTKKIIINRDVVFDKEIFLQWNKKVAEKQVSTNFDRIDDEESQKPVEHDQLGSKDGPINPPSLSTTSDNEERPQRTRRKPAWMT